MKKQCKRKTEEEQISFFKDKIPRHFGGLLLKGNAKVARPLSTKEPVHLVLKSAYAVGIMSMLQKYNVNKIDKIIRSHAKLCRIRIYHFVNVGNHLHLVVKLDDRKLFAKFIRSVSGLIARHVLKKERGPQNIGENSTNKRVAFWVARPFTRLVSWGNDYKFVTRYIEKNRNQAKRYFVPWGFDVVEPTLIQFLNTG